MLVCKWLTMHLCYAMQWQVVGLLSYANGRLYSCPMQVVDWNAAISEVTKATPKQMCFFWQSPYLDIVICSCICSMQMYPLERPLK